MSNAHKATVHRLEDGRVLNTIHYYKYKRLSSEIDKGEGHSTNLKLSVDIISGAPDTSPYAQTGVSVWDVRRLRPQRGVTDQALERLLVIHDMERLNPVICDLYTIADISR